MPRVYLLTGKPGTGKTSLIKQVVLGLNGKAGGFYTEEIRSEGTQLGFKLVTLGGQEATLAHVSIRSPHRVSKYGVDTVALDNVGVAALRRAIAQSDLIIVDEIGKMELFSENFQSAVREAINSGKKVLGTIMLSPHPFADEIKRHPHVKLVEVTRDNRQVILADVREWLKE